MNCLTRGCKRRGVVAGRCRSHARKRADDAFSKFIRERDRMCMAALHVPSVGCMGALQCMHLIPRMYHATRWDPVNAVAGCAAHHKFLTERPIHHVEFCQDLLGVETYEHLRQLALGGGKVLSDGWMEAFAR